MIQNCDEMRKVRCNRSFREMLPSIRSCLVLIIIALAQPSGSLAILPELPSVSQQPDGYALHNLTSVLPAPMAMMVRAGTNRQDLAPYLNRAMAKGGKFDLGGYTYLIASRLDPGIGTQLSGKGTFLADPAFDDRERGDGLQMMIRIVSGLQIADGVVFDGGSIMRADFWLTGARNTGPVQDVVLDGVFRNLSFDGIDVSRNNGAWRNANIVSRATVDNVGWIGANFEGVDRLVHDKLQVSRTGFHGIYVGYGRNVRGDGFRVDKSRPPYRIYNGQGGFGGQEKGFLFGHFSTMGAHWTRFRLFDNRNAGYDGFGIGEDGPLGDSESREIFAQGEIWYAGLFGFDVSSDMIADIAVYYPKRQGVQFGLDLGGVLSNIKVKAFVKGNEEDEAARFSATGSAVRKVTIRAGSPEAILSGGGDFTVVQGQSVSGAGITPGTKVLSVVGDKITLDHPARSTHSNGGAAVLTFRAPITFEDCVLELDVVHSPYGLGVQSDADGFTHYRNVNITGNFSQSGAARIRPLNGPIPPAVTIRQK